MAKTMQCGPLTRSFNVTRADAVEGDDMRIQVEFSSEEPVSRSFGLEVLDHSPKSVRLARLNDGAPFLLDHRSGDSDAQIGVVESATVENGRGVAEIRFSRSTRAQEILATSATVSAAKFQWVTPSTNLTYRVARAASLTHSALRTGSLSRFPSFQSPLTILLVLGAMNYFWPEAPATPMK